MKREKGSTISVPVREPCRIKNVLLSVSEINYTTVYSKLLLINRENVCWLSWFIRAFIELVTFVTAKLTKTTKAWLFFLLIDVTVFLEMQE